MPRTTAPALVLAVLCSVALADDVPLSLWTNGDYPSGLPIGATNGISWGDYDADGYIDIFACQSGNLWRNLGGLSWELAANLEGVMPATERRYGASFGDYNNDGLPDIGTEPRVPFWGDDKMHLLKNLGGGPNFVDVAGDPAIIDVQPYNNGETLCWGDVDGDRNLDAFLPVYPSGPGNFFLYNLGPTGPGGAYRFTEMSGPAGLGNPAGTARPEGAQFVDVDFDGDIDLFSNGTLYQNVSTPGMPLFDALPESSSGIGLRDSIDEGAMFFDYDLDGDQDLFVVYSVDGVRIWENYGDGTFFPASVAIVDDPLDGLNLGLSAEDWDNDGDIDFTTREVFRRNRLIEDGTRHFTVATHSIPYLQISEATPAWGDWDKDGDLDCALGNWGYIGNFYENTLYTPATSLADRRHLRIRALGDSTAVPAGLETEYGAVAELHLLDGTDNLRRRKFVASSHGYLNQNEYTLHFALPPDPEATDPAEDWHLDLSVDFPGQPDLGLWRVDKHVNPALGDLNLADLADREIKVYRCGGVMIDGAVHEPLPLASTRLTTSAGGLALPTTSTPLPEPTPTAGGNWFVGLAFDTLGATESVRVHEIILDGQLGPTVPCGGGGSQANLMLWDVTDPVSPGLVPGALLERTTSTRNRRSYIRTDFVLPAGREYRLVARVTEYRGTTIGAPVIQGPVTIQGGTLYKDAGDCSGAEVALALVDPTISFLALRFSAVPDDTRLDPLGDSLRVDRDPGLNPVLSWSDPQAAAYRVLRCNATSGACAPSAQATTVTSGYTDTDSGDSHLWYLVKAVNACSAGL